MRLRGFSPYLVAVTIALLEWPLLSPSPAVGDNFQFWFAGHLVVTGQSPYDRAAWEAAATYGPIAGGIAANTVPLNLSITESVWLYPPHVAFLFAPFGALPLELGVPLLHAFVAIAALVGVSVAARVVGLGGMRLAFLLAVAVVSQPFVISVRNGHPIGLLVLGAALVYLALTRRWAVPLAAGVILLSLKPQLVVPFAVGLLVLLLSRRDWRAIATSAMALVVVILPAQLVYPFPVAEVLTATGDRLVADLSTTATLARDLGGGLGLTIALALSAAGACGLAWWLSPSAARPTIVFAGGLTLSLALAPYVHDYDLLLCVPVAAAAFALGVGTPRERPIALLAAIALLVVPWLLFYWWPLQGQPERPYLAGPLGAVAIVFAHLLALNALLARGVGSRYAARRSSDRQVTTSAT